MTTPFDSTNSLHKQVPAAMTPQAAPATPDTALASKVASQGTFGLQAVGSFAHCITTEWSTFFRGAKLFTGVAQHLARVGYAGIRGAQTRNNEPLLESGIAETILTADDVLGNAVSTSSSGVKKHLAKVAMGGVQGALQEANRQLFASDAAQEFLTTKDVQFCQKFASLSELGDLVSERGEEILRPATHVATAKTLEPLLRQAEKSFGHLMYALSVNSAKIAMLNRFLQLVALIENQAEPVAKLAANSVFETYLSLRVLRQSLQSSGFIGKMAKLGTLLAACELVHRASTYWKHLKQSADLAALEHQINKAPDHTKRILLRERALQRLSSKAASTIDPIIQAFYDRVPAIQTVFWIHRLVSLAKHPVRTGWSHALSLAAASVVGGAIGVSQIAS